MAHSKPVRVYDININTEEYKLYKEMHKNQTLEFVIKKKRRIFKTK